MNIARILRLVSGIRAVLVLALLVGSTPVASAQDTVTGTATSRGRIVLPPGIPNLPATFVGNLPCADCPGIRYELNLWPDQIFFLRTTYPDRATSFDDIGSWALSADRRVLIMRGGRQAPERFAIRDADTLRKLDAEGRETHTALNHDLTRTAALQPLEPRLTMRGMYRYMADAGRFTECSTGRELAVAHEGDNAALEAAYAKGRQEPGELLMVSVEGRIADRPGTEGGGTEQTLVPERFISVWRGERCGRRFAAAELTNTYWRLTRLGDEPVITVQDRREAHLTLHPVDRRVSGSTGCNQIVGSYQLDGQTLRVGPLATTRMACPGDAGRTEQIFTAALHAARRWNVLGEHLELYDAEGTLLARFESSVGSVRRLDQHESRADARR